MKKIFTIAGLLMSSTSFYSCQTEREVIDSQVEQSVHSLEVLLAQDDHRVKESFMEQLGVVPTRASEIAGTYNLDNVYVCCSEDTSPVTLCLAQGKNAGTEFLILAQCPTVESCLFKFHIEEIPGESLYLFELLNIFDDLITKGVYDTAKGELQITGLQDGTPIATRSIFKKSAESWVCNIGVGVFSGGIWGLAFGMVNPLAGAAVTAGFSLFALAVCP